MQVQKVINGKFEDVVKNIEDATYDSCVTDPPYGLKFMGKKWDYDVPKVDAWKEVFRVLKPGAHILVACGTRTQHRMACNIEDAGFEIRDVITWHYGSGFPKSLDVSKAITAFQTHGNSHSSSIRKSRLKENYSPTGQEDWKKGSHFATPENYNLQNTPTELTDEAKQYDGWGTALKPATEFWTLARKPLSENTVAENVLKHGTGGINIDGSRVGVDVMVSGGSIPDIRNNNYENSNGKERLITDEVNKNGRFPANLILDEFMGEELDKQTGILTSGHMNSISQGSNYGIYGKYNGKEVYAEGDSGGASRFFYCAKADNYERNKGLKGFQLGEPPQSARSNAAEGRESPLGKPRANHHPTVKPIDLMRYLIKLITPKNGHVLDPFNGSGTTGIAAKLEFMNYTGIEMDAEYCKISEARIAAWNPPKYKEQTLF